MAISSLFEGISGGNDVGHIDKETFLVDREVNDENGSIMLGVSHPYDLHLL